MRLPKVKYILCALSVLFLLNHALAAPGRKSIHGDYRVTSIEVLDREVRAYKYGENQTIIEFDNYPLYFSVTDIKGKKIPFKREGKYARLKGIHKSFVANIDGDKVTFNEIVIEKPKAEKKPPAVKGYDFNYQVRGDNEVLPTQIFDDGKKTFMQFKQGQEVPAVFAVEKEVSQLLPLTADPNTSNYSFAGTKDQFRFVLGKFEGEGRYAGKRPPPPPPAPKKADALPAPTPIVADAKAAIDAEAAPVAKSPAQSDEAKQATLTAPAEVKKTDIKTVDATKQVKEKPVCQWALKKEIPYKSQLQEWIKCAGYSDLAWHGKDLVPSYSAAFPGTFLDALLGLKKATGWNITVHEENKIIRIIPN